MTEYIIVCRALELPFGHVFTTIPKFPYERDELVLLSLEGLLIPGRWRPGEAGSDWLKLPGARIELTEQIPYRIIGLVIPLDRRRYWKNPALIPLSAGFNINRSQKGDHPCENRHSSVWSAGRKTTPPAARFACDARPASGMSRRSPFTAKVSTKDRKSP